MHLFNHLPIMMPDILAAPVHAIHAYLDPGSGSFLIQLLIGALVGGLVLLKTYWNRIRAFFSRSSAGDATPSDENASELNNSESDAV
ncbi:MAG: hypothetical protein ACE5E7_12440 [Anaerolineae bacterium]